MGCYFLLQGIFQTQGSNPGHPHCRQMLLPSEPPGKSQETKVKVKETDPTWSQFFPLTHRGRTSLRQPDPGEKVGFWYTLVLEDSVSGIWYRGLWQ